MSSHGIADEIIEYFENYGISDAGTYAPEPDQVVAILEFITDLAEYREFELEQLPDILEQVKIKYKELGALSNQVTNYSDMGDETHILEKF